MTWHVFRSGGNADRRFRRSVQLRVHGSTFCGVDGEGHSLENAAATVHAATTLAKWSPQAVEHYADACPACLSLAGLVK
jgi:hypothetical protein